MPRLRILRLFPPLLLLRRQLIISLPYDDLARRDAVPLLLNDELAAPQQPREPARKPDRESSLLRTEQRAQRHMLGVGQPVQTVQVRIATY